MATELGTAYVSIVAETAKLEAGIKSALAGGGRQADQAGQDIGQKLAAGVTQHVSKAGINSGEQFAKTFSPKVQSAGKSAMQGLASAMLGGAEGIGSQVGGGISGGLVSSITRGADTALTVLGKLGSDAGWSSGVVSSGMVAAGGVALVAAAATAATKELYNIGETWDAVADGITFKTGLVGDGLNAIKDSVKNVASDTAASIGDIADVAGSLTKGLKIAPGSGLEQLTKQISDFNAASKENGGEPVNMREFIKAMKQMKLDSDVPGMIKQFDDLYKVTQNTTLPMNDLIRNLKMFGPTADGLKIPATTLVQIISGMEDSGLNAEQAMIGLRTAWKNVVKDPDPPNGFRKKLDEIKTLLQSTDEQAQISGEKMATQFFGNRAGPAMAKAIKDGNVELDNFNTKAAQTGLTVGQMTKETEDFAQEWEKFKNLLSVNIEPIATKVFGGINGLLTMMTDNLRTDIGLVKEFFDTVRGGNVATENLPDWAKTPGPEAASGILGGAAGTAPGIGGSVGGGGNAASSILGGMAGARSGLPAGVGGGGRGYQNYGKTSAYLDQQAGPVERWRPSVKAALASYGSQYGITNTAAWESAMMRQIATESAGNPGAWNNYDSNAQAGHPSRGLLQFIPGTFGQYNITGGDIMDPQAQIAAFIPYVAQKYGMDKNGAPLQVGRGVGYDTGGWLPNGTQLVTNATGKPELILNPDQQQNLADQGVDPQSLLHGTGQGTAPGPQQPGSTGQDGQPNYGMDFMRSLGFIPASAGSTGVAGTSSLAKFINMGNSVVSGVIDTGVNLANTAATAAIGLGTMGAGAAAGPAASMAASYGIQLAGNEAKRISSYWFQMAGIGADALMGQLPFGGPRWLGYDYTGFAPQLGIQQAATSTIEKMGSDAINKAFQPGGAANSAAGPVSPSTMPGASAPPPGPPPGQPGSGSTVNLDPSGPAQGNPNEPPKILPGLFDQGGMLPPGGMGVNMTSRPEPVLTPQQWDSLVASSSSPAQGAPLVGNLYAQDMQGAIRELDKVRRRDMMQYAGRS